jgi:hypothetical protein
MLNYMVMVIFRFLCSFHCLYFMIKKKIIYIYIKSDYQVFLFILILHIYVRALKLCITLIKRCLHGNSYLHPYGLHKTRKLRHKHNPRYKTHNILMLKSCVRYNKSFIAHNRLLWSIRTFNSFTVRLVRPMKP